MTIRNLGFFRELRHGNPSGPSLKESIGALPPCDLDQMVHYLQEAPTLAATGSRVGDVLNPDRKSVSRLEIATDGFWVWPRDLAYYVREYRVALPDEFIRTVESLGGEPPELDDETLERLEGEVLNES